MNWQTVNFDWNRARAFLVTAEEGSFSAAARALSTTQPTIGRQVAALEAELGVTLFERVGTRLVLTPSGLELVEHVRAMGEAATRVSLAATGQADTIEGNVCITASESVATYLLPRILAPLRLAHPGIELELAVSNEAHDLHRREADIAIRNFQPSQPDLIARKVSDITAHFYAAPSYVERVGPVRTSADLPRIQLFAFDRTPLMRDTLREMGIDLRPEQFPITTSNHLVQWELCKQGAGVCMMMEAVAKREPAVVRVLEDFPSITLPLWVVCHRELQTSRRFRLVFDWLAEGLKEL